MYEINYRTKDSFFFPNLRIKFQEKNLSSKISRYCSQNRRKLMSKPNSCGKRSNSKIMINLTRFSVIRSYENA